MEYDKKLGQKLENYFESFNTCGLAELLKRIQIKDENNSLEYLAQKDMDIIWYPGCGGDISPCSVLEKYNFEKENGIDSNNAKLYIFTDPGCDHPDNEPFNFCRKAYGGENKIYDLTCNEDIERYIKFDSIEIKDIFIGKANCELVKGKFISLVVDSILYRIIYLKMPMENFLINVVRLFNINIKWLFFINMNTGWDFFQAFLDYNINFPQWVCANRPYGLYNHAELKPMTINGEEIYKLNYDVVKYGKMDNTTRSAW